MEPYQFNRVYFSLRSSSFHVLRTIRLLASDEGGSFHKAKETIVELVCTWTISSNCIDDEEEAIATTSEVIGLMKAGQFDLVKWTSISQRVLNSIPLSHRLSSVKEFYEGDKHKVLGLCWSPTLFSFSLKISTPAIKCTKRTIFSGVARIWDLSLL